MSSKNGNNTREADELFILVSMWVAKRKPNHNHNALVSMLIKEGIGCLILILSDIMLKISLPGSILGNEHPLSGRSLCLFLCYASWSKQNLFSVTCFFIKHDDVVNSDILLKAQNRNILSLYGDFSVFEAIYIFLREKYFTLQILRWLNHPCNLQILCSFTVEIGINTIITKKAQQKSIDIFSAILCQRKQLPCCQHLFILINFDMSQRGPLQK